MDSSLKGMVGTTAVVVTVAAFLPYIVAILRGKVRPHAFSWVIWGTTTFVVFLAQRVAEGGAGSWAIGVSAGINILIAALAFLKRTDATFKRIDRLFLGAALSSLPFWYLTSDPLWAVVVLTTIDLLGFGPTLRKAHAEPHAESVAFFGMLTAQNILILMALENYSATTVLFPAAVGSGCLSVSLLLAWRRRTGARTG
jgi:hypothetical protein